MHEVVLKQLFKQYFNKECNTITQLPQAGSDRIYFRLSNEKDKAVATFGNDVKENETFIYLSKHFLSENICVPEIYTVSDDKKYYLQEDIGDVALYSLVKKDGITPTIIEFYKKTISALIHLQIDGAKKLDFDKCYPIKEFDKSSMFWDLNSFKYYFARVARVQFNETELNKDFHTLSNFLLEEKNKFFMFRDCQSRNVFIKENEPVFIDFQGGRKGALQYDIASLLWQAGAKIPYSIRKELFDYYVDEVAKKISINKVEFESYYHGFVFIRMLQVLGAYGFRGLIEKRSHFLESIQPALENVNWFLENIILSVKLPELYAVLNQLIHSDVFKYNKIDGSVKPLLIEINSFSFKRGIPKEESGNGGGFVFDCRGLHNPGRYEPYKQLTGKDSLVIEFLESQSQVKEFLEHVWQTIDITVENYLQRDFEHLQINFGCTGGQHRSVYCAEATMKHLKEKYNVKIVLKHIEREIQGQII